MFPLNIFLIFTDFFVQWLLLIYRAAAVSPGVPWLLGNSNEEDSPRAAPSQGSCPSCAAWGWLGGTLTTASWAAPHHQP